jgi:hypothetical protein
MQVIRAALRAVTLAMLVAFPLSAQGVDLTVNHVGIGIGDVPRVTGLRLNFRDRALDRVDGVNVTIWDPYDNGGHGVVHGLAVGVPLTGAARIDGIGVGIFGVSARDELRGIGVGGLGVGANDLQGLMIGGLGAGAGHDAKGLMVGGLGVGAGGSARGILVGGLGVGAGKDVEGIMVGGLGVGAGGDLTGLSIGGVGVGVGQTLRGVAIGGVGVGAVDVRGLALAGFAAGARDVRGALVAAGWTRLEHGTLRGVAVSSFNQMKGVQRGLAIGVVNYAEELHGVQIGLVNIARNNSRGTRVLPIFNVHRGD